jgi:hypothetical protein
MFIKIALNPVRLWLGTFCSDSSVKETHMLDESDNYQLLLRIKTELRILAVFNSVNKNKMYKRSSVVILYLPFS